MQSQTYVAQLLYSIAKQINRPPETVNPYIQALENNWFDTKESLMDIDTQTLEKMQIPQRLCQLIMNQIQLERNQTNVQQEQPNQQIQQQQQQQSQIQKESQISMIGSNQQIQQKNYDELGFQLKKIFPELKKETITSEKYHDCLITINTILNNIAQNPNEEKFRKIKFTNQKFFNTVAQYNYAMDILLIAQFETQQELIMKTVDVDLLQYITSQLQNEIQKSQKSQFDPYKTYIQSSSNIGLTNLDVAKKTETSANYNYVQRLDELKRRRDELIKPLNNRFIRILKINPNKNFNQIMRQFDQEQSDTGFDQKSDPVLAQAIKDLMINLEEQTAFTSKSKKEFLALQQAPLYLETTIRIRFPNSMILEAKFTPKEFMINVINLVKECLYDNSIQFYLYQTPPVQIMNEKFYYKTMEELSSVPSGLFYFGFEDKSLEQKQFKLFKDEIEVIEL